MTDILQLSGWTVSRKDDTGEHFIIEAEYTKQPDFCLLCGLVGALYRHGPRPITFLDSPIRGKPSKIVARVQRYKCRDCGGTFLQPLDGMDDERRMTKRCLDYIEQQCLRDTFQRVSEHLGCDEKTIRNIATDYIKEMDTEYKPYLPEWIGLDETHLNDIFRGIVTDIGNRKPIDLLPTREKPELMRWFSQFKDRSHVKGLAIDMWPPYRDLAGLMFKDLPVVVDKFHLVKKANESVERTRVRLGKGQDPKVRRSWMRSKGLIRMRYRDLSEKQRFNLDMWLDNETEMAVAYRLKERLFNIYDKPKAEAIEDYDSYAAAVPDSLKADFHELTRAMKNWRKEILNYFDYPITNAYTEGVNGVAKVMNRMGRGYSFEVIRARLLFNNRPQSKRQLRAKKAAAATAAATALYNDTFRCDSCGGLYYSEEIMKFFTDNFTMHPRPPAGDPERSLQLCTSCHARFHTEEVVSHDSTSTTKSG